MIDDIENPEPLPRLILIPLSAVAAGAPLRPWRSELAQAARAAEHDDAAAERAWRALLAMAPLLRRRLLTAWRALNAATPVELTACTKEAAT